MRYTFAILILVPSLAMADVDGIRLAFNEERPQQLIPMPGQLIVGEDLVAVLLDKPTIYRFDGNVDSTPTTRWVNGFCFAGEHAYAADAQGIHVYETKAWAALDTLHEGRARGAAQLASTPDGRMVFLRHLDLPGQITYYLRDSKTGKLSAGKSFVESELTLARQRAAYARAGKEIHVIGGAVRIDNLKSPQDMKFSTDGHHLFVPCFSSSSLMVFGRKDDDWTHLRTLSDFVMSRPHYGMQMCRTVATSNTGDLFVGGLKRLGWLHFDGKAFTGRKWWTDDTDPLVKPDSVLPCIEAVTSLVVSKNGRYLFVASKENPGIAVLEINEKDLRLEGFVDHGAAGSKILDVRLSNDGKKLFAKSTASPLLIYDLDERFTN